MIRKHPRSPKGLQRGFRNRRPLPRLEDPDQLSLGLGARQEWAYTALLAYARSLDDGKFLVVSGKGQGCSCLAPLAEREEEETMEQAIVAAIATAIGVADKHDPRVRRFLKKIAEKSPFKELKDEARRTLE